ncbi:hypothetical protein ACJDT4_13780 [Clostridium neuense]|uniref:Uncharacterized protein n=1 Tax=Clostridium neuense TaxID=1728934 RepID=A0ABW8TH41_9CLOT
MESKDKVTIIDKEKAEEQERAKTKDKRDEKTVPKLNDLDVSSQTMYT